MKLASAALAAMLAALTFSASADHHATQSIAPEGAEVYFISPQDGDTLENPVTVRFGLRGMGVAPAGVEIAHTGHHHLLVDMDTLPDMTRPLPSSYHVLHFGKGQTEAQVKLRPGTHTLQLLLGNHLHIPHEPPVLSEKITITVD